MIVFKIVAIHLGYFCKKLCRQELSKIAQSDHNGYGFKKFCTICPRKAFALGYRRLAWRCHTQNEKSVSAALRLGFCYEGVYRNHMVVKGYNRDTAWFSITDDEFKDLDQVYSRWFRLTANGRCYQSLSKMVQEVKLQM